ncbi:MAG TPA: DUF4998 domain-containing protein [Pedobacter sp.]|uniref:DUF4998 domain-containing protein n=1 Tax=Pedobacter sp. TaxID=1411316 RepID=UPI002BA2DF35|nr:DUF4998 domain-containing protein [Pedobacter sp.]HMI01945.1 DUF4998 domain-containing protein [Pedobacter sp.]
MKLKEITTTMLVIAVIAVSLAACSKMDSTYVDFIKKGSIVYVGTPDSLKAHSGKNRLKLTWLLSDPSATRAQIYWNNKSDSLSVPVSYSPDGVSILLENLNEGSYSFNILMYDKDNNRSITANAIGMVYGDNYIASLLSRPAKSAEFENKDVTITWGPADGTVIGTEISYTDISGNLNTTMAPVTAKKTALKNFDFAGHKAFQYRTMYVPDSLSLDTFYSATQTVTATNPATEHVRSAWTVENVDFDGTRVPKNVLDKDSTSIWHMDKSRLYPHTITIDMKTENLVNGLVYRQRVPLDGAAKLVEILVSSDNLTWRSLGAYTLENSNLKQFLELLEPASFRYFKMVIKSDYKNGQFTAIAELGTYKR